MVRFIHTSDWQLGISRSFFDEGARERYAQARIDCLKRIGTIAIEEKCAFILVCGDVFESNQVGRKTILRTLAALGGMSVPVYLLPGNHDPLNDVSVYSHRSFLENLPENVIVLENDAPLPVAPGVELVAAPWRAKNLADNPLHALLQRIEPVNDVLRIIAAHGEVDIFAPMSTSKTCLSYEGMKQAISDGKAHFIALGDRHSFKRVDSEGRICYSGTPEVTAFRETNPGHVALVELSPGEVAVRAVRTGEWAFLEMERDLVPEQNCMEELIRDIQAVPDKDRAVVRITLSGLLTLSETSALRTRLGDLRELFAAFELDQTALHTGVTCQDIEEIGLTGFAASTAARLKEKVDAGSQSARDALLLLAMLTGKQELPDDI